MKRAINHSYYVVMRDFGGCIGFGADVTPELTRNNIIDRIKSKELDRIAFIHHIADGLMEDVTAELIDAAEDELKVEAINYQTWRWDHERDHHKNLVVL